MHSQLSEHNASPSNKFSFAVMTLSSYYHFYRINLGDKKIIAKVFPPEKAQLYRTEQQLLSGLSHSNLPKPIILEPSVHFNLKDTFKGDILIYPEASLGDLLTYVGKIGGLSQKVACFYLRQICEAFLFVVQKKGITHNNLTLQNMLLESSHNLLVGGWTNSQCHKRDPPFAVAQMAVSMVSGRRPFVTKDIKHDQLGKFLKEDRISKFWQLIEKATKRSNKSFTSFSEEFKTVIGGLFLYRMTDISKLLEEFFKKLNTTLEDVHKDLRQKQTHNQLKKEQKKQKERALQKYQKQVAASQQMDTGSLPGFHKEPSRSADLFLQEFSVLKDEFYSIPHKNIQKSCDYFELFDNDPRVILAHLRTRIQQCERHQAQEYFVHPFLVLKKQKCYASLQNHELRVNLPLEWHSDLGKGEGGHDLSIEVILELATEKEELLAAVVETENTDLNSQCLLWVISWLRQTLTNKV